ncbi:hypothetical protein Lederberg_66 [Pelagibacter phage Lederberg EXVC029P]|nr:hypothetical protein Lederberg_66 [Pelagibacter phage Lederberg EXVC029P]
MRKKIAKRKQTPKGPTTDLLIQMMNDMNSKLHQIHKDVTKNKQDITKMQQEIAFGRGGVKAFVWLVGLIAGLVGFLKWNG